MTKFKFMFSRDTETYKDLVLVNANSYWEAQRELASMYPNSYNDWDAELVCNCGNARNSIGYEYYCAKHCYGREVKKEA